MVRYLAPPPTVPVASPLSVSNENIARLSRVATPRSGKVALTNFLKISAMQFPPKDENASKEILNFIQSTQLKDEQWNLLKSLYKQLEIDTIPSLFVAMIYKLDKARKVDLSGAFPTWKTVTYLKRRAARYLRKLAIENETLYVRICKDLMLLQKKEIHFEVQWVMNQMLVGDSKRFEQKRNGRGEITQKIGLPNIVRSEEKFSEIWNKYPAVLELILKENGLAIEVYEFAIKVLLRNGCEIPVLNNAQFDQFFQSDSPFLHYSAAEQGFEKLRLGIPLSNNLKAKIYFFSDEKCRKFIINSIQNPIIKTKNPQSIFGKMMSVFAEKEVAQKSDLEFFVNELTSVTFQFLGKKYLISNRIEKSLNFLFKHKSLIQPKVLFENANSIFLSEKTEWEDLVLNTMPIYLLNSTLSWLVSFKNITNVQKDRIFLKLSERYQGWSSPKLSNEAQHKFIYDQNFLAADFGWFLICKNLSAASQVMDRVIWNLSWKGASEHAFQHLVKSRYATEILLTKASRQLSQTIFSDKNIVYVINNGHDLLRLHGQTFIKKNAESNFFGILVTISRLSKLRDKLLAEIEPNLNPKRFNAQNLFHCLHHSNNWVSENTWRIIEAKTPKKEVIQQVLLFTIYQKEESKVADFISQISAIKNPVFKQNFTLALSHIFQTNPHAINRMANLFDLVMQVVDIESIIRILKAVDDRNWNRIKPSIQKIAEGKSGVSFWLELLDLIAEEEDNSVLVNRFLEDPILSQTFFKIKSPDVLDCHHPAFENILARWLKSNENLFESNSPELFKAATHRLPKIRNWALQKAQDVGMDVPFAMELMESGLPESVKFGQQFFEKAKAGTSDELENLLALCDSPNSEVRLFGMSFFQSRKDNFDSNLALECLSEHTDPIIQEFIAEKLGEKNSSDEGISSGEKGTLKFTRKFDQSVLRTKNRGRKAKELVKNRLEEDLNVNVETLLELARGHNKKDKEWALEQLTKLALKGEEMPDFQLV